MPEKRGMRTDGGNKRGKKEGGSLSVTIWGVWLPRRATIPNRKNGFAKSEGAQGAQEVLSRAALGHAGSQL